ncbi:MAG: OmpH family outer membrane protein [Paracoccus sp. (in: a-proteobacteria)]|nr:OmpH family outer membrane protein [Paracoccus sp. (in: a-proteobacteria)]
MRAALILALLPVAVAAQDAPPVAITDEADPMQTLAERPLSRPQALGLELTGPAQAQVLAIDPDRLFAASAWGRRAQTLLEAQAAEIAAENERLERQFTADEQALTAARDSLAPDEFRRRAEAFDVSAQSVRRERAEALRGLSERADAERAAFLDAAVPVIAQVMEEHGASVLLDRRTIFLADERIDITGELMGRIDAQLGDGAARVAD